MFYVIHLSSLLLAVKEMVSIFFATESKAEEKPDEVITLQDFRKPLA